MTPLSTFVQLYKEGKVKPSTMAKAAAFKAELEKTAGPDISTFLRYLSMGLLASTGLGLAAAGAKIGVKALEEHNIESKKDELFRDVLKLHPDLTTNKDRAKLYFEALIHFSPTVATNPLTAGAYIRQALQYDHVAGGPLPTTVNELTQIQKQVMEAKRNAPSSALGTIVGGITEAPTKMIPSFMSYGDFSH